MSRNDIILLLVSFCFTGNSFAQPATAPVLPDAVTVLYDISINSSSPNTGIAETYNGGIKTIMMHQGKTRIRLVTLMRIQSIYFFKQDSTLAKVLITKESGKEKYKYPLSPAAWKVYNAKYDSITYTLVDDSIAIAGYNCKKAIITVPGKDKAITAYYSTVLKPLDKNIEPLFAGLPGMVLKYVQEDTGGSISFTANKVSFEQFDAKFLQEPTTGYVQKNYSPSGK